MGLQPDHAKSTEPDHWSLMWRMVVWALLVMAALLPIGLLGVFCYRKTSATLYDSVRAEHRTAAQITSDLVYRDFTNRVRLAEAIATNTAVRNAVSNRDPLELQRQLGLTVQSFPRIRQVLVADPTGVIWADYPPQTDAPSANQLAPEWHAAVSKDLKPYLSGLLWNADERVPLIVTAVAVKDDNGQVLATLAAYHPIDDLAQTLNRTMLGAEGSVMLVDHLGHVVRQSQILPGSNVESDTFRELFATRESGGGAYTGAYKDPTTERPLWATVWPVLEHDSRWVVVAQRPVAEIEQPIRRLGLQMAGAAGVLAVGALAVVSGLGLTGERIRGLNVQLEERAGELARSERQLLKQTTIAESILANMADGVAVADESGRLVSLNPAASRILGIGPHDAVPADASSVSGLFMPDMLTPIAADQRPILRAVRGEEVDDVEEFVRPAGASDGTWISVTARPLRDERGVVRGGVSVFRDISERKRTERRLAAQHATTRVLAEAATLDEATPRILEAICNSLAWEVGAIWRVDSSKKVLRCVATWHRPGGADFSSFETVTRETLFEPGVGLPGRVWGSGQPAWIVDVLKDSNFPRAPYAARAGLHGAFGFPIILKGEVLGVIEFFSCAIRQPDDEILHMIGAIGSQIGQFIERRRAEEALRVSEHRLQSILDNAPAVIYVKDRQGRYLLINRQYERLFHITREQIIGQTDYAFFPHDMADVFTANDRKVLEAGRALEFDEFAPQDDGIHAYLSIKFPLMDASGADPAVCGISTDITDRKRTEEALKHERYLLHMLMDTVPDAIYFKDAQSRFIRINRALAKKNGLADPDEAIGKTDFDFFTREHAQPAFADEQRVMQTGEPIVGKEEKETWPDGSVTWVSTTKLPLRDAAGNIVGTFGISRDVTKRKYAEEALRDSEALYHSLVESLPLNVIRKDLEGRVTFGNSLYCKSMGKSLELLLGMTDYDLFPPELAEKYRRDDQEVTKSGAVLEMIEEHQTPRGERIFVQVLKSPIFDAKQQIVGTQVIYWDVTARKRAEESLKTSERRYRQFTEGSQDAIVVANQQGYITLFNVAAQHTFGYTEQELLGQPITRLMPPEFHVAHAAGFERYLRTREPHVVGRTVELRGLRKNGEVFPLDLSLTAIDLPEGVSFLAAIRDSTERHRMQNRVIQSEKMASLGLMSAGIAHEINNPLAFVANNLAVLDRDVKGMKSLLDAYDAAQPVIATHLPSQAQTIREIAEEIDLQYLNQHIDRILDSTRQGVKRVADIVQNLRGFARLDQAALDRVDIHAAIRSSLELIQGRMRRRNITVVENFGELPPVACSPAQINQVFLNLLVNATQAIESSRKASGQISITTRATPNQAIIEIADDGCGIPSELLPKIFDPFFTTKKIGEGTGLGLSITHGIVRDHNGEIEVESKPGEGTCFRILLPLNPKEKTA